MPGFFLPSLERGGELSLAWPGLHFFAPETPQL